jgi:hypothetical protein
MHPERPAQSGWGARVTRVSKALMPARREPSAERLRSSLPGHAPHNSFLALASRPPRYFEYVSNWA